MKIIVISKLITAMLMLGESGRTSLNKSRTLGNTLLYRKVHRISPLIFRTIPCTFCAVIETFLLEQNLAKRTRRVCRSSDFRVRSHETTSRPGANQNSELPRLFGTALGKNVSPGALLALLCFSSSPFTFARLDFSLPPRSAPGSPRMARE